MSSYTSTRRPELTARQCDVLELVAQGRTNAAIGRLLHITEESVKRHLREIRLKLDARDRAHAVNEGWRLGYLGGRSTARRTEGGLVSTVRDRVR